MSDNQVWNLVDPTPGVTPIGCKWIFKVKTDMDGKTQTYKARLVTKGYRQIHGIDYDETFSPVAMVKSIRILLAIAAYYDYEIWQMDVKTAFLNGNLTEDVYMSQPEGFVDPENEGKICKLQRSIYGLKQASRSWNIRFLMKPSRNLALSGTKMSLVFTRRRVGVRLYSWCYMSMTYCSLETIYHPCKKQKLGWEIVLQ